jgi:nucleoside-diphosphate-sugar epimerase
MNSGRVAIVLGGYGFIGRRTCRVLAAAGWDVLAVSRQPLAEAGVRTDALDATVQDLGPMLRRERPAVVVNAAGGVFGATEPQMWERNVVLVERLIAALADLPYRARLIQLGTVLGYGGINGAEPTTQPIGTYGQTKLLANQLVLSAHEAGSVEAVVLPIVNVIGAGASKISLFGRVTAELVRRRNAERDEPLELTTLDAERDHIAVEDAAQAVLRATSRPVGGQVIPIGSGVATSVRQLVRELVVISGVRVTIVETPPPAGKPVGLGAGARVIKVDPSIASSLLGWHAVTPLSTSLREMWRAALSDHPMRRGR